MKRSSGPRKTANLSESTNRQLNKYALAAGAAGVGMLASANPAYAKIVYTPSNIPINVNGALVDLDLNHDGINDFQFYAGYVIGRRRGVIAPLGAFASSLWVYPLQRSNRVWAVESQGQLCAAAAPAGKAVGPHRRFQPGNSLLFMAFRDGSSATSGRSACPWRKAKQAYVGLKFLIKGKVHFGWARIKMLGGSFGGFPAKITGYAYETIPNYRIITGKTTGTDDVEKYDPGSGASLTSPIPDTPQPVSLGMLALGAQGVPLWRRKESALQGN
jgi:hypothetical protein